MSMGLIQNILMSYAVPQATTRVAQGVATKMGLDAARVATIGTIGAFAGNVAVNTTQAIGDYKDARQGGDSKLTSVAKAVTSFAAGELFGLGYIGISLAGAGAQGMIAAGKHSTEVMSSMYGTHGELSGYFNMSQAGYTMRQRSINAIRNNGLNLNQALGNEARTYLRY